MSDQDVPPRSHEATRDLAAELLASIKAAVAVRNRTTGATEAQRTPGGAEKSQELTTTDDR